MNRIEFMKLKQAIECEFRLLRKRLSSGETTIKMDINGISIILISVSEFSPSKCDPCFNQLICGLRETVRRCPRTIFINHCLFYRDEPAELMRLIQPKWMIGGMR